MKLIEYCVLEEVTPIALGHTVDDALKKGWIILGGVSVACRPNGEMVYCQAVGFYKQ